MDQDIPFQTTDRPEVLKEEHKGETGLAFWQTELFEGLRIRVVEYSARYLADHWCTKGPIYLIYFRIYNIFRKY